jgi:hypothetical protein
MNGVTIINDYKNLKLFIFQIPYSLFFISYLMEDFTLTLRHSKCLFSL